MPVNNIHYYILQNHLSETTGGQTLPEFPFLPDWCNLIEIQPGKANTPNPPPPVEIIKQCETWLEIN